MKKILLLLIIPAVLLTMLTLSCKKEKPTKPYSELIVGRWKTDAEQPYHEVYYSDGTGKFWDEADDVTEEEATTFDWSIDSNNKLTQIHHMQEGQGDIPQYCNILTLNETTFKYNNEGWRAEYTLYRE